jgi:hypothetical protein
MSNGTVGLKADFLSDWISGLRRQLTERWGTNEVGSIDDNDIPYAFFDSFPRKLEKVPRLAKLSAEFRCPPGLEVQWQALKDKIENGADLNPHLSTRHASISNPDGMLAEWDVHHFHLGAQPHPRNPSFVERTGPLAFARIDNEAAYVIGIYDHKGSFEDTDVLEILHQNWPETISRYRVLGVTGVPLEKAERRALRSKNANVLIATRDGTVYMPISSGVTAAGKRMSSVLQADGKIFEIRALQTFASQVLVDILPALATCGYAGEPEIEARLLVTEAGFAVFFPKLEIKLTPTSPGQVRLETFRLPIEP